MPLIQVKLIENVFTPTQKEDIITQLTEAMVAIEGENLRPVTWVVIEEVRSGEWGVGGKALTTGQVRALAAGGPPDAAQTTDDAETAGRRMRDSNGAYSIETQGRLR